MPFSVPPVTILIAGLGKTGTTALFFKIKGALPSGAFCLFEPSVYHPPAGGATHVLAKILIGGTMPADIGSFRGFDRKILLIRDPRDTAVSRVLYNIYNDEALCADDEKVDAFVSLIRRKEADPSSVSLRDLAELFDRLSTRPIGPRLTQAPNAALAFQRSHPDFFAYRYRDLVRGELAPLEAYLGFSVDPDASVSDEFRRVARTKTFGDWRNWFTPTDVEWLRPAYSSYLAFNRYPLDWTLPDQPGISPEHGSDYVLRLVDERRRLTPAI